MAAAMRAAVAAPFESPGSRRTASNACRRVKSLSEARMRMGPFGQVSGAAEPLEIGVAIWDGCRPKR